MMTLDEKFRALAADNAPGQEVRQAAGSLGEIMRGEKFGGIPVDFLDASHQPDQGPDRGRAFHLPRGGGGGPDLGHRVVELPGLVVPRAPEPVEIDAGGLGSGLVGGFAGALGNAAMAAELQDVRNRVTTGETLAPGSTLTLVFTVEVDVDDVEATAREIETLGGKLHCGPMDIPGMGRFAVGSDPTGATFAIWKSLQAS